MKTLRDHDVRASFFFTGNFYRDSQFKVFIKALRRSGHYLGAHSDKHLLYCDWSDRDSLLVTPEEFRNDLLANYAEMAKFGIRKKDARYFLPPFEWYNDSIAAWTAREGLQLINFSPGTISHADYTTPEMKNYRSSETIYKSVTNYEEKSGLNGFILLIHTGTDPRRTDKFYRKLGDLIVLLKNKGYKLVTVDQLLKQN